MPQAEDPRVPPEYLPEGSRARVIAEHQDEYLDLPAIITPRGVVISRWSFTPDERARIAAGEDVFVTLWAGNRQTPTGPQTVINPMHVGVGFSDWTAA